MQTEIHRDLTVKELVAVFKDRPLEFAAGERFAYSNSGYVLLGAVIEAASGQTYEEFIGERFFKSLGMNGSYYGSNSRIIPGRGARVRRAERPGVPRPLPEHDPAVRRRFAAVQRGRHGAVEYRVVRRQVDQRRVAEEDDHALHPQRRRTDLLRLRAGGGRRARSSVDQSRRRHLRFRDPRRLPTGGGHLRGRAVQQPGARIGPGPLAIRLAAAAAGDPFPQFRRATVGAKILEGYVGVYRIDEETTRTVVVEDGRLYTQRSGSAKLEALPASDSKFFYEGTNSWFELDPVRMAGCA